MALNPVADSVLAKQLEVAENENPDSQSSHITHGDEDEQSQSESITKEKSAVEKEQDGEVAPVEYVTGWKLVSIMVAVTSACFIMLLDMSIIVTVRSDYQQVNCVERRRLILPRLFLESQQLSILSPMWVGTAAHTVLPGPFRSYLPV